MAKKNTAQRASASPTTPGPWHHGELSDEILTARGEAVCAPPSDYDEATWHANARLITEAPAMREALKAFIAFAVTATAVGNTCVEDTMVANLMIDEARALLRRIDGTDAD